ncbi:MAG: TlpA disulfide reductase family protein [Bacteroidota bacterium]
MAPKLGLEEDQLRGIIAHSERPFVLVNFFATWCKPCKTEFPDLVALHRAEGSEIDVVLVSIDEPHDAEKKLPEFLGEFGVDFQTYARTTGEAALIKAFYPAWDSRIPLTLLYNRDGKLLEAFRGLTARSEIEMVVNKYKTLGS